jgi:hypothetical protein
MTSVRGDKNIRRAGKGAAASQAWDALSSGPDAAGDAATTAHHIASDTTKEAITHATKHPWHTAPWESAKAAFGVKGAAIVAGLGGVVAVGLVAVAAIAVAGGGKDGGGDLETASSSNGDKDSDQDASGGDKPGRTTTTVAGSTTTGDSTTTTTIPGQTTTTGRAVTPGSPGTTRPPGTSPTTARPPVTVTTTTTTTAPPLPPKPQIRTFTAKRASGPCRVQGQILVTFAWTGGGTVTSGTIVDLKTGAGVHSGIQKPIDSVTKCVDPSSGQWRLTLTNAGGSDKMDALLG